MVPVNENGNHIFLLSVNIEKQTIVYRRGLTPKWLQQDEYIIYDVQGQPILYTDYVHFHASFLNNIIGEKQ